MLELKIFAIVNKNYRCVEGVFTAVNASLAIRDNFQSWCQLYPALIDDYDLVELGSIPREIDHINDLSITTSSAVVHSWNSYEEEMEYVPQHLSERQKELLAKQNQMQLEQISQLQERIERVNNVKNTLNLSSKGSTINPAK